MFILSDQIIILSQADTFSRKQLMFHPHYKRNKYKLLKKKKKKKTIMHVSLSVFCTNRYWYSKFGFETKSSFGFENKTADVGFLGSISQTRRKCIYER